MRPSRPHFGYAMFCAELSCPKHSQRPPSSGPEDFHWFSSLPSELRDMIWAEAAAEPRVVDIRSTDFRGSDDRHAANRQRFGAAGKPVHDREREKDTTKSPRKIADMTKTRAQTQGSRKFGADSRKRGRVPRPQHRQRGLHHVT